MNAPMAKLGAAALIILDVLMFIAGASGTLHLQELNVALQTQLAAFSPTVVYGKIREAEAHCWTEKGIRHSTESGCDGSRLTDPIDDWALHEAEIPIHELPNFRALLCKEKGIGCHNYDFSIGKQISVVFFVIEKLWVGRYLPLVVWFIGIVVFIWRSDREIGDWLLSPFVGLFYGSVVCLFLAWSLEALSYLLGYVLGFISWLNGLFVIVAVVTIRKVWKLPKGARELAKRAQDVISTSATRSNKSN